MVLRGIFGRLGEIDKVRSFPNRPYAFVQFFDTATALRAREQVRKYPSKLNDPRVSIRFSKQVIGEKHRGNDGPYR